MHLTDNILPIVEESLVNFTFFWLYSVPARHDTLSVQSSLSIEQVHVKVASAYSVVISSLESLNRFTVRFL